MVNYTNQHAPTLRVIMIVDYISSFDDNGVSLSDIYKNLDIPKTTVFNIINTLVSHGVIEETGSSIKKYKIGFQSYVLAKRYLEKMTLIQIAEPILKELSDITKLTSFVAKQDKSKVFYMFKYEPKDAYRTLANIGSTSNINSTSLGKAYLMTLSDEELKEKLQKIDYVKETEKTLITSEELYKEIIKSKKQGYSIDDEENMDGLVCFGAPIKNEYGEYEASISISGLFQTSDSKELYGRLIKQAAEKISQLIGYRKE